MTGLWKKKKKGATWSIFKAVPAQSDSCYYFKIYKGYALKLKMKLKPFFGLQKEYLPYLSLISYSLLAPLCQQW